MESDDSQQVDDDTCFLCHQPPDNPAIALIDDVPHVVCTQCRDDYICGCGG